jgi:hypothetical protein
MPSTINGLIVLLVALIPGVPGETVYSNVTGLDWREDRLRRVIRIVIISIAGLLLYVLVDDFGSWAGWYNLSDPKYVMPAQLGAELTRGTLSEIAWAYIGHVISSSVVGAGVGYGWNWLAHWIGSTPYPAAWDDLINTHSSGHWVIVSLHDGDTYAGIIETADTGVPPEERDVLLLEPAKYREERDAYVAMRHQHLFLPAALIASMAVVYDEASEEERITQVGQEILTKHTKDNG